jgi:hypothetical protein
VSVVDYNSLKLEGELNVTRSAGGNQRAYYTVEAAKNGAGVWQVSASYTGDDVLYTTLPSWDVASNNLQVTMPLVTNFSSASLTYALNAPAVGASLPLSVDSSSLNIVADAPLSYRNRIINGDMRIDQRNAGTLNNSSQTQYHVDRWNFLGTQVSKFSIQKSAVAPSGFTSSLLFTSLAATTAGASDWWAVRQVIEGFNVADLGWGTADAKAITISFWARSSLTGVFGGSLINDAANRSYAFTYSISAANTWEYKTVTIPGDTSGTWLTDANAGIRLVFGLGAGASAKTAAGSWTAGAFWGGATGTVDLIATNGATLYLSGVQLEVGSKASAFERRPYGMELALCQRYYWRWLAFNAPNYATLGIFAPETSTSGHMVIPLPTTMRAAPAAIVTGSWEWSGGTGAIGLNAGDFYSTPTNIALTLTTAANPSLRVGYIRRSNNVGDIAASAEL